MAVPIRSPPLSLRPANRRNHRQHHRRKSKNSAKKNDRGKPRSYKPLSSLCETQQSAKRKKRRERDTREHARQLIDDDQERGCPSVESAHSTQEAQKARSE
jgi:hypothetical protein